MRQTREHEGGNSELGVGAESDCPFAPGFSHTLTSSVWLNLSSTFILKFDCWGSHSNIWQKEKALCSLETNSKMPWRCFIDNIHHLVKDCKVCREAGKTGNRSRSADTWKLTGWKTSLMSTQVKRKPECYIIKTHLKIRQEELKRHCKWAKGHLFHQEDIHIVCGITAYQSCKTLE